MITCEAAYGGIVLPPAPEELLEAIMDSRLTLLSERTVTRLLERALVALERRILAGEALRREDPQRIAVGERLSRAAAVGAPSPRPHCSSCSSQGSLALPQAPRRPRCLSDPAGDRGGEADVDEGSGADAGPDIGASLRRHDGDHRPRGWKDALCLPRVRIFRRRASWAPRWDCADRGPLIHRRVAAAARPQPTVVGYSRSRRGETRSG
jgi:hypothetical protein